MGFKHNTSATGLLRGLIAEDTINRYLHDAGCAIDHLTTQHVLATEITTK
jgi:hypothetical protein